MHIAHLRVGGNKYILVQGLETWKRSKIIVVIAIIVATLVMKKATALLMMVTGS